MHGEAAAGETLLTKVVCSRQSLLLAAFAVAVASAPVLAADAGHVAILHHDGSPYGRLVAGQPNVDPRRAIAQQFFLTHSDAYDFLVVFPTFQADLEKGPLGLHTRVRNDVAGIGMPISADPGFGSAQRLKGYIDVNTLPGATVDFGSFQDASLVVLAHEVEHQWGASVQVLDPVTARPSAALLSGDVAHWSPFLDSDASVLGGSLWSPGVGGSWTAVESRKRYSDLDLYLMGFLPAEAVAPFALLSPSTAATPPDDGQSPFPDGTTLAGTARTISVGDVIAAEGPRVPAAAGSQRTFRAAFALLLPPGAEATANQIAYVDGVRREWANRFFLLTRGLAVMDTELAEAPAVQLVNDPTVAAGLRYLLSRQRSDGTWADQPATVIRDTHAAVAALALFATDATATAARDQGAGALRGLAPATVDEMARRVLSLAAAGRPVGADLLSALAAARDARLNRDGGFGIRRGYASDALDTALAGAAQLAGGKSAADLSALTVALAAMQGPDGGFPYATGGPSRVEPTARTLEYLARLPQGAAPAENVGRALVFLAGRSAIVYDDGPTELENALATSALAAWRQDAGLDPRALLFSQRSDGSWSESVRVTGEVLRALRTLLVPNLILSPAAISLSASTAVQGEPIAATVQVRNDGHGAAPAGVFLRATDSSGAPFGSPVALPAIASGASTTLTLTLDTTGHQGSTNVFFTVDPDRLLDETRKDDNQAAVALQVNDVPQGADLYVSASSLAAAPAAIDSLPTNLTVGATVGNLGSTGASAVSVVLYRGANLLGSATVELPPHSTVPVSFPISVSTSDRLVLRLAVDPQGAVADANPANNSAVLEVPVVQRTALALSAVTPSAARVTQGAPFSIGWSVANTGTVAVTAAAVTLDAFDAQGNHLATPFASSVSLVAGETRSFLASWHADVTGPIVLKARASATDSAGHPVQATSDCVVTVDPSAQPNLLFTSTISVAPDPVIAGKPATATVAFSNAGGADAGPFVVEAYLGDPAHGGTQVGRIAFAGLTAGGASSAQVGFTLPAATDTPFVFLLDAEGQVAEFDEDDNAIVVTLHPRTIADLTVGEADIQPANAFPKPGDVVPVQVLVHNLGGVDAHSVPLQLWLGSDAGGTLIGSATLDVVASGAASASFAWNTAGASAGQQLVAVVNGARTVEETSYDNNRATKTVLLQAGPIALSNPFFSPNGDGVRDTTEVFFRFPQPVSGAVVRIADGTGALVRTLQQPLAVAAASGSVVWDGADDAGNVVRDGSYSLTVFALDGGSGPLGPSIAVVDTNRSPLADAAGTAYLSKPSLEPYFARHDSWMSPPAMTFDDRAVVYGTSNIFSTTCVGNCNNPFGGCSCTHRYICALQQLPIDLGTGTKLTTDDWGIDCPYNPSRIAVSPDSQTVAMADNRWLRAYSIPDRTTRTLYESPGWVDVSQLYWFYPDEIDDSVGFSSDGRWIRFRQFDFDWRYYHYFQTATGLVRPDGSGLHFLDLGNSAGEKFSPDATRIAAAGRAVANVEGGGVLGLPGSGYDNRMVDWSPDSRSLYFAAYNFWDGTSIFTPWQVIGVADLPGGRPHVTIEFTSKLPGVAFNRFSVSPADGTLAILANHVGQSILYTVPPGSSDPAVLYQGEPTHSIDSMRWSPQGSYLLLHESTGWSILQSLRNLGVRLSAMQDRASSSIVFTGTVADANFSDYDIAVRPMQSGAPPAVVVRGTREVLDDVLGSWIPPAPGVYEATLTARDKAGNVRSSRVFAASTLRPALTAFSAEPRYISPNGDGVQDKATIRFSVNAAVSTRFDVVNSAGKLVRSFSRTLLQPGDDSFDWDGTDASGSLVADGEYLIRCSDGGAVQVGVDLTPPKAYFSWSNQAEKTPIPYILTATQSQLDSDVDGRTVAQMLEVTTTPPAQASDGSFVQVAQLGLRDLWQGYDRLEGSPVETLAAVGPEQGISQEGPFAALADPAVPGEIANVTELVKLTRTGPICGFGEPPPLPLSGLRGEWFRARAVDRAGNVTSTRPHQIPRALYALGIGDAAELDPSRGTVTVAGEVLPRVDRLMTLYPQGLGADCHASPPPDSRGPFFQPGKLGIHVQFTGPERIVSFAVRYPTVTGAPATDWQNVTWLAPGALIWDASYIAWDVTHIEVIGTDELGREWSAPIDFAIPPRDMAVSACASVSGNLRLAFSGVEGQVQSARVELYAAGARLPEQVNVLGASDLNPSDPNGVTVPSRSLSQCRYRANLVLTTSDGRMWRGGTSTDVCTFEVRSPANMIGRELHVDVANSFRGIITSLDAYAVPVRQPTTRIPVGTIASAQNLATLSFDASRLPACMQGTLQFVVHFWNAPDYDSANDDASCGLHSSSFSIPCDSISVAEPAPPPPAPSCTIQKPDFTIAVGATTARAGGKIVQLHAALRSAQNLETQPLALDAFEPAATVATAAHVASAPLAEGIYFIGAAALDSGGDRAVHGFDPEVPGAPLARNPVRLIVDRTPPVATIANPADGARVCAIQATSPDGRATSVFRVLGTVSDAHLTDFLVEMAPLGESFDPYFASDWIRGRSSATIAADVDLAGLAARDYRVRLVARDVSGSSGCSPPVTVHLDPAVRLSAFSADDRVFSPDGDGVSDVAKLRFHLDESAAVKLEAQGADGTFSPALVTNASFGDSVLTWDGTLASGSRLADGDWLLRLTATDGCANTSAASTHVGIDTAAPTVQIDSPVPGAAAAGQLLVRGRVDDANLTGYQVLLGSGSAPAQFAQVAASDHPDTGVLAAIDLTGLAAGSYVLRLAAQDSVGHATTADVPFVVGTPSLIAQLAAVPALYSSKVGGALAARVSLTSAASVRLVLEDSAGASLAVIADGLALAAGTSTIPVPVGSVSGLADGQYRLRLDAVSATAADSAETWLVLDATAPSIDGVLPVDQAVTPADVDVFARIADPHLVSWSVEVETTAGFVQVAGGSSAPASAVAQLRGLAEGPHRLRLRARDGAGNSNERIVPFTVDATPPVLHFVAPVDGDLLAGRADPNHVVLAFADAHPATLRLEAVRRADGSTRTLIDTATAGGTITVPWTVGSEQDGSFTLRATAEDAAGNRATASIGVTIDNDPPAVAIYQPGPGFLRDIYVIGAVTDENLASWTLEMARGPAATAAQFAPISGGSASGSVFAVLPQFPDDGTYTFRLSARDRADNEAATSVEVVADRTPPPPPQTVSAAVQNGRDILVSWVASAASDVTAYAVQRATGNGDFQDLATVSAPALVYRDAGLSDQSYRYRIVAVDAAGNASAPSSVAQGDVHASPPLAAISSPRPGTPVSGVVQITGTAVSAYAFKEYRLSVGAGAAPTSWTLLTRSAQPVAGGVLGRLDTLAFAQGSQQSILLEVEDTYGNHSQQTVTIAIDDVAPAAPVLLSATAQTSTVTVTWRAGGTDADVAGYLVYRNGAVANAPDAFTDLTPWLLPPTTTMWTDSMRPDGLYTYQVQAMDAAGNLSPLSNSIDVRIDLGAPAAHISSPEHLVRVTGPFIVSADLPDQDVTSVQLQVKAATASSFTTFATLKAPPWTAQVDPATLAHPAFEVRALATDASGKVDPAPAPVTIFYAPLPAVPLVQTHTDGSNVTVSWSLPAGGAPAAAVLASSPRYLLGTQLPLPSGTTSASVGNAAAGYDGNGSTYWQGAAPGAQYWQVLFSSPLLANGIRPDLMGAGTKVDVSVRVSGGWVRIGRIQRGYSDYVSPAIGLGGALLLEGVRLDFPDSYTSFFELYFDLPYVTATPTATETGAPTGNRTYTVQAISAFGQTAAGTASALIYAPDLDPVPVVVGAPDLTLTGCTAPGADAHVLVGATEVAVAPVGTDCRFTAHVPLATGTNDLTVRGIDASGNRSVPAQRSVLLDPAPSVALALTGAATTSTVDLTWTAQGDASNVDHLELWRAIGAGDETLLAALDAATRQYRDANLANGWYRYRVLAANAHGFTGAPSNQANIQVQVDPPPAPTGLAVTAPEEGSSLRLAWSEAAAVADYLIERADSAGSFQPIGTTATPAFTDAGLTNGATYSYRVRARDALGNASSPSAVARGVPADRRVPLPPVIDEPTTAGNPISLGASDTPVGGSAQPGTIVDVFRNGELIGSTPAVPGTRRTPIHISFPVASAYDGLAFDVKADGSRWAYLARVPGGFAAALETADGSLTTVDLGGAYPLGLALSPDGSKATVVASGAPNYRRDVQVIDFAARTATPLVVTPALDATAERFQAAWSPDSQAVAYIATEGYRPSVLAMAAVAGGAEQVIADLGSDSFRQLAWPRADAILAAVEGYYSGEWLRTYDVAGNSRTLYSGRYWTPRILASTPEKTAVLDRDYWPAKVRIAAVDGSGVTDATSIYSYSAVATFSADGHAFDWIASNQLWELELASGAVTSLGSVSDTWYSSPAGLFATTDGRKIVFDAYQGAFSMRQGNFWSIDSTPLAAGDNVFTARAARDGGPPSAFSEPVVVTVGAESLADLTVEPRLVPPVPAVGDPVSAVIRVRNIGAAPSQSANVIASVLGSDGSLRSNVNSVPPIDAGGYQEVAIPVDITGLRGLQTLVAAVQPLGRDANHDNDEKQMPFIVVSGAGITASLSLSSTQVGADGTVQASMLFVNSGPAVDATVRLRVLDTGGDEVFVVDSTAIPQFQGPDPFTASRTIAVGRTLAGDYQVVAEAVVAGAVVASAQVALRIVPDVNVSVSAAPGKAVFAAGEVPSFRFHVQNRSRNSLLAGAVVIADVSDQQGANIFTTTIRMPTVLVGGSWDGSVELPPPGLPAGAYVGTVRVLQSGLELAAGSAAFEVAGEALLEGAIEIAGGRGSPPAIPSGSAATLHLLLTNSGTVPAAAVQIHVGVLDPQSLALLFSQDFSVDTIVPGDWHAEQAAVSTAGLALKTYAVSMTVAHDGGGPELIATRTFRVADAVAPVLSVPLAAGAFVRGKIGLAAHASDDASGVIAVSVSVDGAAALPLLLTAGTALDGDWRVKLSLADGPHTLFFSAVDAEGNLAALPPIPIVSDATAPSVAISGVADGALLASAVRPDVSVTDANLALVSVTLNATAWVPGSAVEPDGDYELVASAVDRAGNEASRSVSFSIDRTAPEIAVLGVTDGQYSTADIAPVVQVRDRHPADAAAMLDGLPLPAGAPVTSEGTHFLEVDATDAAGNHSSATLRFTIDRTPPVVAWSGFFDGAVVAQSVVASFTASDANLASAWATANGRAFASGGTLSEEGTYVMVATAADRAGNQRSATATVTIDRTAPTIALRGFAPGSVGRTPVTPVIDVEDANLDHVDATLNGAPFVSGTTISAQGAYALLVTALDRAGNRATASATFTIDTTPPPVTLGGFVEGMVVRDDVSPTFSSSSADVTSVAAVLNGAPFVAGTVVHAEGAYTFTATATDAAGNRSSASGHFTIDRTPPEVTILGVRDGDALAGSLRPDFSVSDANLSYVIATLNNAPFTGGTTVIAEDQYTLVVRAVDKAGNRTERSVTFAIDRTAPSIWISGVADGAVVSTPVTLTFGANDLNQGTVSATLNGAVIASGTTLEAEGEYLLSVTATDRAGNTSRRDLRFAIDRTPPQIVVSGVSDGAYLSVASVVPTFTVTDPHPGTSSAKLDRVDFVSGTAVTSEMTHNLVVSAADRALNPASVSVTFTIDRTPPQIAISGVSDGVTYDDAVAPLVTISDANPDTSSILLNDQPFTSGTRISEDGTYTLSARAKDKAANSSSASVTFTILQVKYAVQHSLAAPGPVLALLRAGTCDLSAADQARIGAFLGSTFAGRIVSVATDDATFLSRFRSGLYRLLVRVNTGNAPDATCRQDADAGCASAACILRRTIDREVTEAVFSGRAGLIVLRDRTESLPGMREALGADSAGSISAGTLRFGPEPAFASLAPVAVPARAVRLDLIGAAEAAAYGEVTTPSAPLNSAGAAHHIFGAGQAVVFGFDLSASASTDSALAALSRSAQVVAPLPSALGPLGVAGVEIDVVNLAKATTTRVREFLPAQVQPLASLPATSLSANPLEWQLALDSSQGASFAWFARVPEQPGKYTVTTEVAALRPSGTRVFGSFPLDLQLSESARDLAANAVAATEDLPVSGHDGAVRTRILQTLAGVSARPIGSAADIELDIADLLSAVDDAKTLQSVDPTPVRLALDELIRYWEARWALQ